MTYKQFHMKMRLMLLLAAGFLACKKDGKFQDEEMGPVTVSIASTAGTINVPDGNNYILNTDQLSVPLNIVMSASAPKYFTLGIRADEDTVRKLIETQALPDAVLLDGSYYALPRSTDIRFGLDSIPVMLEVNMQAVEKHYGKNLVLAVRLENPGKQNALSPSGSMAIVVINTAGLIREDELHYLSFTNAGTLLSMPSSDDHTLGETEVILPVSLTLGGAAGGAFALSVTEAADTAQALIDDGTITDGVLFRKDDDYMLPLNASFDAFTNTAKFDLRVKTASLKNNANRKPVLALTISDPTKHLIDETKKTLVMVLDPARLIETDITGTNIRYTTQYENTSNANETSGKLIDNNINTKFLLFNFTSAWMKLEFDTPQTSGAYTLTSANDAPDRDPKNWTLEGSNNDVDWVVLDQRTDQSFGSRFQTVKYTFPDRTPYKYYRLNITAVRGGTLFQMAEWRLIKRP